METIIYTIIFIIGTVFGSFYTLATYRIPKKQDITHTRSYCPNCNHKLGFFDMLPVLSYIFLGGKCRYCGKKISPRYIFLEILSGIVFVSVFYLMKIDFTSIYTIEIGKICTFFFMALYITFIFLTAGIDKENKKIENSVTTFGTLISLMYIAYLCIVEKTNIYRYAIYIICYIILLIINLKLEKSKEKNIYINGLLFTIITMATFTGEIVAISTILLTAIFVIVFKVLKKGKISNENKTRKGQVKLTDLNIAFFTAIANILSYIIVNIL